MKILSYRTTNKVKLSLKKGKRVLPLNHLVHLQVIVVHQEVEVEVVVVEVAVVQEVVDLLLEALLLPILVLPVTTRETRK